MLSQTFSTENRIQTGEKTQNIHKILRKVPENVVSHVSSSENPIETGAKTQISQKFWEKNSKLEILQPKILKKLSLNKKLLNF